MTSGLEAWLFLYVSIVLMLVTLNFYTRPPKVVVRSLCCTICAVGLARCGNLEDEDGAHYRLIAALAAVYYLSRIYEITGQERFRERSLLQHISHAGLSFHDVDLIVPVGAEAATRRPHIYPADKNNSLGLLQDVVGMGAVVIGLQLRSEIPSRVAQYAAGILFGGLYVLLSLRTLSSTLIVIFGLFGFSVPRIQVDPLRSKNLREFWGDRWNTVIQKTLHDHVYRPCRDAGFNQEIGTFLTFAASGFLHVFGFIFLRFDMPGALSIFAFFIVQFVFLVIERGLRVSTWPAPLGSAWVITCLIASSPLLFDPGFRAIGAEL